MNIPPKNLMILAGLGFAAYVLTRRKGNPAATTTSGKVPFVWSQSPTRALTENQPTNLFTPFLGALSSMLGKSAGTPAAPSGAAAWTQAITNNAQDGNVGFGWQYFNDGTTISPEGVYYKDSVPVYTPDMSASNTVSGYPTSYQSY